MPVKVSRPKINFMTKPTIYDVSRKAKVSITTVSRTLNAPDKVNIETRKRVLAAIEELNFVPKFEALNRARKTMGRIGVLTPYSTSSFHVDKIGGIIKSLSKLPYETVIFNVESEAQRDNYIAKIALTGSLDGLIILMPTPSSAIQSLLNHHLPVVQSVEQRIEFDSSIHSVINDSVVGGSKVAEYLLGKGHRLIGFIGDLKLPDYLYHTSELKLNGFRQVLTEAGVELPNAYISLSTFGMEQARRQALELFQLEKRPSVIFAASDTQAIGVLSAARQSGMSVPDDLAVIGYDDIETAEFIGLTTVRQYIKESAQHAVKLLLSSIADYDTPTQQIKMPVEIIERFTV